MAAIKRKIILVINFICIAVIAAGFIAAIGISGAAYTVRRLINTHGEFSLKSFFHGIKVGYFHTVLPVTIALTFLFATFIIGDWMRFVIAIGGNSAGAITAYVFIIIATVLVCIYSAWLFAVGTSYRVTFAQLFKNAFVLMIGTPIQTVFMAGFSLIPVWLVMIGGVVQIIGFIAFIFIGFSFILVSWTGFTQWAFDAYVNPNLKPAKEQVEEKTVGQTKAAKEENAKQRARELLAAGRSELIANPIMPIAAETTVTGLGKTFKRGDVAAVAAEREKLVSDIAAYGEEHKTDAAYIEYNKLFAEREKALQPETDKKGKKKKKISSDNLLK